MLQPNSPLHALGATPVVEMRVHILKESILRDLGKKSAFLIHLQIFILFLNFVANKSE